DPAAVLDGGGDQLVQPAEQHDRELAGRRPDAGRAQLGRAGQRLNELDEHVLRLALQLAGALAERRDVTDPAQRQHRLGLGRRDPALDGLAHLGFPRLVPVHRGRDLPGHLVVGLAQQRDVAVLPAGEVRVERAPRGARVPPDVRPRAGAVAAVAEGGRHPGQQPPAGFGGGCVGRLSGREAAPGAGRGGQPGPPHWGPVYAGWTLCYSGVPADWYARVPRAGWTATRAARSGAAR